MHISKFGQFSRNQPNFIMCVSLFVQLKSFCKLASVERYCWKNSIWSAHAVNGLQCWLMYYDWGSPHSQSTIVQQGKFLHSTSHVWIQKSVRVFFFSIYWLNEKKQTKKKLSMYTQLIFDSKHLSISSTLKISERGVLDLAKCFKLEISASYWCRCQLHCWIVVGRGWPVWFWS